MLFRSTTALGDAGAFFGRWGGRLVGAAAGEFLFPTGGGVPGAFIGGQFGDWGGRLAGEWLYGQIFPMSAADGGGNAVGDKSSSNAVPRDIWWPDRKAGQWSCKARADCNDNIPGNCAEDPSKRFSFGGGTANDLGTARNTAKANATANLQCQPKHVSCKCTGPKGEQYSGGC